MSFGNIMLWKLLFLRFRTELHSACLLALPVSVCCLVSVFLPLIFCDVGCVWFALCVCVYVCVCVDMRVSVWIGISLFCPHVSSAVPVCSALWWWCTHKLCAGVIMMRMISEFCCVPRLAFHISLVFVEESWSFFLNSTHAGFFARLPCQNSLIFHATPPAPPSLFCIWGLA